MKLGILIVFSVIADISPASREETCSCVPLTKCPNLEENLKISKEFSVANFEYIKYLMSVNCRCTDGQLTASCPSRIEIKNKERIMKKVFDDCGQSSPQNFLPGNRTYISDFPSLALLEYDTPLGKRIQCGGVLVGDRYILTTARCVPPTLTNLSTVRLGEHEIGNVVGCQEGRNAEHICPDPPVRIPVEKVFPYEDYASGSSHKSGSFEYNDIALVKMRHAVRETIYVRSICLPRQAQKNLQKLIVAGWSVSHDWNYRGFDRQLKSRLTVVDLEVCRSTYSLPLEEEKYVCAGDPSNPEEEACIADNGGSAISYAIKMDDYPRMTVVGISYAHMRCSLFPMPGIYMRVHDYVPWIIDKMLD